MECLSYCIANKIDLSRLDTHFKTALSGYASIKSRDYLKLTPNDETKIIVFVFKNGTVVSWGVKRHQMKAYLDKIRLFVDRPISFKVHDEFSYKIGDKTAIEPHDFFDVDCLIMDEDSDELKLSLSYGFSQSVKLQYFEKILEALIEKVKHYHQDVEVHEYLCAHCRKYSRGIFDPRFYDAEVLDAFVVWAQEFVKQREAQHGKNSAMLKASESSQRNAKPLPWSPS